jgi:NADP-dependent 3-hydroxy acid dehydrogenase YdfG
MKYKKLGRLFPCKSAVITGAGSGLGLALTELLLKDGWKISAIDLKTDALEKLRCHDLQIFMQDITDSAAYRKLIDKITSTVNVDILFNNAGVGEGTAFEDYSIENWDWIININLKAVLTGTHYMLPHFRKKNSGMFVNLSSAAGYANLPDMSPYNVTKAAVISLSETLSHELSGTNIKVKCFTPTFFRSQIMQHSKGTAKVISSAEKIVAGANLSSMDAAHIILSNLHTRKEVIRFPFSAHFLYSSKILLPSLFRILVRRLLVKKKI